MICHERAIHSGDGANQLMCHRADGREVIFHGEVDIACPGKTSFALGLTFLHGLDAGFLRPERGPATCAEVTERATCLYKPGSLLLRLVIVCVIIEAFILASHHIMQFGDNGQYLDLKKDGIAPVALEFYMEMPLGILPSLHPTAVVAETLEITHKPCRDIVAFAAHESYLLICDDEGFEHADLFHDKFGKPLGIDRIVAVVEFIFHLGARIIIDDGTTHGEFIEVIVGEVVYDLSHA